MILGLVAEAQAAGVRLASACRTFELPARTVQRWRKQPGREDQRRGPHQKPGNALTTAEENQILTVLTSPRYAGLSPKQLVPQLADEGLFLASESTLYRVQRRHRLRRRLVAIIRSHVTRASTLHRASGPNQVWSWDITWLPTNVLGRYFYLYLVMDVWSRRIVGWTIADAEAAETAAKLVTRICRDSGVDPEGLVLHADNGAAMRGNTMVATLQKLGIIPSFSRPHVSDDNAYSESLFRTLKHTPAYPRRPFDDLAAADAWMTRFGAWYNGQHRHSGIRFVTPDERHFGRETAVLAKRHALYQLARAATPERWTTCTRNWSPIGDVTLNPQLDRAAA
jgi:transposase InsO family protein